MTKSLIVAVPLSNASVGGEGVGEERINAKLTGGGSNLGVKMLHMPPVSESWAMHLVFLELSLKQ